MLFLKHTPVFEVQKFTYVLQVQQKKCERECCYSKKETCCLCVCVSSLFVVSELKTFTALSYYLFGCEFMDTNE